MTVVYQEFDSSGKETNTGLLYAKPKETGDNTYLEINIDSEEMKKLVKGGSEKIHDIVEEIINNNKY